MTEQDAGSLGYRARLKAKIRRLGLSIALNGVMEPGRLLQIVGDRWSPNVDVETLERDLQEMGAG